VNAVAPASSRRHPNPSSDCSVPAAADHIPAPLSANVRLLAGARCPFLDDSQLCQIQLELGESFLSHTCSTYPRSNFTIHNIQEKTLSLSCPEAARLVLLAPRLTMDETACNIEWDDSPDARFPLQCFFWPIREFSVSLIRNRAYPLWQRMFLLAVFANRLDALARGQLNRGFAHLLDDFARAVQVGSLRNEMEKIPPNPMLQLQMVLRLINLGMRPRFRSDRFNECLSAFARGIGHLPGVPIQTQVAKYSRAYSDVFEPFFGRHPEILENYLVQEVVHILFPFGQSMVNHTIAPQPAKAFAFLALQFAILKGLLIGSAAFHGENFSIAHVIQIVQTAYKHFEHDHDFLVEAQSALAASGLENIPGLTALLRN
jgi:lysine-N-methylase